MARVRVLALAEPGMIQAHEKTIDSLRRLGYDTRSLWVGDCVKYAETLRRNLKAGTVVAIRQETPTREYHTVLKYSGKYYDVRDVIGVPKIEQMLIWDHYNKGKAGNRTYITYKPGNEPK